MVVDTSKKAIEQENEKERWHKDLNWQTTSSIFKNGASGRQAVRTKAQWRQGVALTMYPHECAGWRSVESGKMWSRSDQDMHLRLTAIIFRERSQNMWMYQNPELVERKTSRVSRVSILQTAKICTKPLKRCVLKTPVWKVLNRLEKWHK